MKPPKCRFCDVVEWRHVCAGIAPKVRVEPTSSSAVPSRVNHQKLATEAINLVVNTAPSAKAVVVNRRTRDRHKPTAARREYVRLKMRAFRAARREAGA